MTTLPTLPEPNLLQDLLQQGIAQSERAVQYAQTLQKYQPESMTPEQDQELADYLVRARRTLEQLKERRAPLTRTLDAIRQRLIALEAPLDPRKPDSIVAELQQKRDAYAKRRLQESYDGTATEPPPAAREGFAIEVTHPRAYLTLLALYIEQEQPTMEKLARLKLEQLVSWAERLATSTGEVIEEEGLSYIWSVRTVAR